MTDASSNVLSQLRAETGLLVRAVERLTGLTSNWSGDLVIGGETDADNTPLYLGAKPWNCDIALHKTLGTSPARSSTLIHEGFHSVSVGLNEPDYRAAKGYEEGVVEQCTPVVEDDASRGCRLASTDRHADFLQL